MSKNDMVMVPRELLERYVSSVEGHSYGFEGDTEIRALLDHPAEHQGEPVCETCDNQGAVGNILNAEPCPDCSYSAPVEIYDLAEFERENRYIAIKKSRLDADKLEVLECFLDMHGYRRALVSGLVVESDWPEYEPTWATIAARVALEHKPEE